MLRKMWRDSFLIKVIPDHINITFWYIYLAFFDCLSTINWTADGTIFFIQKREIYFLFSIIRSKNYSKKEERDERRRRRSIWKELKKVFKTHFEKLKSNFKITWMKIHNNHLNLNILKEWKFYLNFFILIFKKLSIQAIFHVYNNYFHHLL